MSDKSTAQLIAVLKRAIETAETRMDEYLGRVGTGIPDPDSWEARELDDHRAAVGGDLCEALNSIAPDLGERFFQAMFPEVPSFMGPETLRVLAIVGNHVAAAAGKRAGASA